jgi:hypothetical protein
MLSVSKDYIALKGAMINQLGTGKHAEGSTHILV